MSCIVKSYDKKTGTTYVYSSEYQWDPKNKRSAPRRRCIGKLDPVSGVVIPTGKRGRPKKATSDAGISHKVGVPPESSAEIEKQLSDALLRIQREEIRSKGLEAKVDELRAENQQLKRKLNACLTSLSSLKKSFNSHCTVLESI